MPVKREAAAAVNIRRKETTVELEFVCRSHKAPEVVKSCVILNLQELLLGWTGCCMQLA